MNKLAWLLDGREKLQQMRQQYPFAMQTAKSDGSHRFVAKVTDDGDLLCMRCGMIMTGSVLKICSTCGLHRLSDEVITHIVVGDTEQDPSPLGA